MLSKVLQRNFVRAASLYARRSAPVARGVSSTRVAQASVVELSDYLEKKIAAAGADDTAAFNEVGKVISVGDGIARVYGLNDVQVRTQRRPSPDRADRATRPTRPTRAPQTLTRRPRPPPTSRPPQPPLLPSATPDAVRPARRPERWSCSAAASAAWPSTWRSPTWVS